MVAKGENHPIKAAVQDSTTKAEWQLLDFCTGLYRDACINFFHILEMMSKCFHSLRYRRQDW